MKEKLTLSWAIRVFLRGVVFSLIAGYFTYSFFNYALLFIAFEIVWEISRRSLRDKLAKEQSSSK